MLLPPLNVPHTHAIFASGASAYCRLAENGMVGPSSDGAISCYLVIVLACDGTVTRSERVWTQDDEEAMAIAMRLADGRAADVWDGLRFVEHVKST